MTRILLVTNASHDSATEYLHTWSNKVMEIAKQYNTIEIFELNKEKANKKDFEKVIEEKRPQFIVMHGHGGEDCVTGYNMEVLVKVGENHKILEGKIIHALACKSGKKLSHECINIGSTAYIGYKEDYKLTTLGKTTSIEQSNDKIAQLFLDPAFEVVVSLIKGKSVDDAFKNSQNMMRDNLLALMEENSKNTNKNNRINEILSSLYHNFNYQMYAGNGSATF